jgi:BCD family chlorophyll transporter-like MFS transporter
VPVWLVSLMVALPVLFAPLRALIGFKSDIHRSAFGCGGSHTSGSAA